MAFHGRLSLAIVIRRGACLNSRLASQRIPRPMNRHRWRPIVGVRSSKPRLRERSSVRELYWVACRNATRKTTGRLLRFAQRRRAVLEPAPDGSEAYASQPPDIEISPVALRLLVESDRSCIFNHADNHLETEIPARNRPERLEDIGPKGVELR
jgi:hypothetical protein